MQVTNVPYLGEFHSNKTRNKYVTFNTMFMSSSLLYVSAVACLIIPSQWMLTIHNFQYKPWRLYILSISLINLLAFCGSLQLPDSPKFMLAMGKNVEALDILRNIYQFNTGLPKQVCMYMYKYMFASNNKNAFCLFCHRADTFPDTKKKT